MQSHLNQCNHNLDFHKLLCEKFSDKFFDWKITVLFYTAHHYLKAYYTNKGIDIGSTHNEIEKNINPKIQHAPYKIDKTCWGHYKGLYRYSQTARYEGIADIEKFEKILKDNHDNFCIPHLDGVKKYITGKGFKIA